MLRERTTNHYYAFICLCLSLRFYISLAAFFPCLLFVLRFRTPVGIPYSSDARFRQNFTPRNSLTNFIRLWVRNPGFEPGTRFTISAPINYHNSPRVFHYTHDSPFTTCAQDILRFISDGSSINFLTYDVSLPLFTARSFIDKPLYFSM